MNSSQTQTQTQPHLPVEPESNSRRGAFHWKRLFGEVHPYDSIVWEKRTAKIERGDGTVVFEQKDVEVPSFWTQTATDIVASKYFRGRLGSPERETSARQMVDRVVTEIRRWGLEGNYFASSVDADNFAQDLTW
ncbi:MAG: vitamin B12-dependent ribonucleotide reductase, partial [Patescibacteria group bacterium]